MARPVLLAVATLLIGAARPPLLADLRWTQRVVLVFAPSPADSQLAGQRRMLGAETAALAERQIRVVTVAGDAVEGVADSAVALRRRYDVPPGRFAALLIGKDGHVARRQAEPFAPAALFGTIDAMPMRRDELKHR